MDPEELAGFRADELTDLQATGFTITVLGVSQADTELGGQTTNETPGGVYPANLQTISQPKQLKGNDTKQTSVNTFLLFLPWDALVDTNSKITTPDGTRYEVIDTNKGENNRFVLKVNLVRAQ